MSQMVFRITLFTFLLVQTFVLGGCPSYTTAQRGNTQIIDASAEDEIGGTGTSSGDIRTMAERMAREITGIEWPKEGEMPRIAVLPVENQTRFRIDSKVLQNKLVKELVNFARGRVVFLARDSEEAVMAERAKKRSGMYDKGKEKALYGADYLLKGEMRALSKASRDGVSDYIVYSFSLIDAESSAILWMSDYETKKVGNVGVIYQ